MKKTIALLAGAALMAGCVTQGPAPDPDTLRVAVSADSQPVVFKQGGQIVGIEADFAHKLGAALNKNVVFVEVPWDKLIDSLEQNKVDIIMSGMTITAPRSIRINFTTPYMQSGLTGLFRRNACDPSGLIPSTVMNQTKSIGAIKGTTGEFFIYQNFARADKKTYASAKEAIAALKSGKINMFVHDAPIIWWLSAVNESELVAFPDVLNFEPLAWGVRKSDGQMLDQINALVDTWSKDGASQKILQNWVPNLVR